mgnify:CR=1 FL=1
MLRKMMTHMLIIVLTITCFIAFIEKSLADPLIQYQYLTNFEKTEFNEVIWFWNVDTLYGSVHSNDFIGVKGGWFGGQVSTSQGRILMRQDLEWDRYFANEPIYDAPPVWFPSDFPHLRQAANPRISSHENRYMTWIRMMGEDGIDIFQYPHGTERSDSLLVHLEAPFYQVIHVEGDVEIEGTLVGALTVYSSGDMYLLDNCIYEGADPQTGEFEEEDMLHYLGLVSGRDIIVKDTEANGRANGVYIEPENMDRHSIIITAALIATNGSFTIEHLNRDWELYQGPVPDRRGRIIVNGSITQWRRGYVSRSEHEGTGYAKRYYYDNRFQEGGPPGFRGRDRYMIQGRHDYLYLRNQEYQYNVQNANIGSLTVDEGVNIELVGPQPIIIHNNLDLRGTEENPIIIRPRVQGEPSLFRVERGQNSIIRLSYVIFESNITAQISCDSLIVNNCEFNGAVNWEGTINVTNSTFADRASMTGWNQLAVSNCVFEDGLDIAGNTRDGHIINNTFVKGTDFGLRLRSYRNLEIVNNIIAFNEAGIENRNRRILTLSHNNVYGNEDADYVDCIAGEGSISADPGFVNLVHNDFHLSEDSPCINAGNPDFPFDPDGTRADIGAFYFPNPNSVNGDYEDDNSIRFELSGAYPNPFNSTTKIEFNLPFTENVSIRIFDIKGRQVTKLVNGDYSVGSHQIEWSPDRLGTGVYLIQIQAGEFNAVSKVMLIK